MYKQSCCCIRNVFYFDISKCTANI